MELKELLTKRKIEALASKYEITDPILRNIFTQTKDKSDVFVSHSSSDVEFIEKVLVFLKYSKGGVNGYVDWQDPELPSVTNATTARVLKDRIRNAKKVIYVVTNESLKSVWCSWEIGYADCNKGVEDLAVLAIKPNNGKWKNNEYLQQYPWIRYDQKDDMFYVVMPDGSLYSLHQWLSK